MKNRVFSLFLALLFSFSLGSLNASKKGIPLKKKQVEKEEEEESIDTYEMAKKIGERFLRNLERSSTPVPESPMTELTNLFQTNLTIDNDEEVCTPEDITEIVKKIQVDFMTNPNDLRFQRRSFAPVDRTHSDTPYPHEELQRLERQQRPRVRPEVNLFEKKEELDKDFYILVEKMLLKNDTEHFENSFNSLYEEYQNYFSELLDLKKVNTPKATKLLDDLNSIKVPLLESKDPFLNYRRKINTFMFFIQKRFVPSMGVIFDILSFFIQEEIARILQAPREKKMPSNNFKRKFRKFFNFFPVEIQRNIIDPSDSHRNLFNIFRPTGNALSYQVNERKGRKRKKKMSLAHRCTNLIVYLLSYGFQPSHEALTETWWEFANRIMLKNMNTFLSSSTFNNYQAFKSFARRINVFIANKEGRVLVSNFYLHSLIKALKRKNETLFTQILDFLEEQNRFFFNKKDCTKLLFSLFGTLAKHEQTNVCILDELSRHENYKYEDEHDITFCILKEMIIKFFDHAQNKRVIKKVINLKNELNHTILHLINSIPSAGRKLELLDLLKKYDFGFSKCPYNVFCDALLKTTKKQFTLKEKGGSKPRLEHYVEYEENIHYSLILEKEFGDDLKFFDYTGEDGETSPIFIALSSGNIELVIRLLKRGVNPNDTDKKNRNCAGYLVRLEKNSKRYSPHEFRYESDEDFLKVLRYLTRYNTRFDDMDTQEKLTPFFWILKIAKDGNRDPLETLLLNRRPGNANGICSAIIKNKPKIQSLIMDENILEILLTFKGRDNKTLLESCEGHEQLHERIRSIFEVAIGTLFYEDEDNPGRVRLLHFLNRKSGSKGSI